MTLCAGGNHHDGAVLYRSIHPVSGYRRTLRQAVKAQAESADYRVQSERCHMPHRRSPLPALPRS